jgi:hypothetical protein
MSIFQRKRQAAKEAAWEKECEEFSTEIGKWTTYLSWLKKIWPVA